MSNVIVIINEQHKLMTEQFELLTNKFGEWSTISVPAEGWNREEMNNIMSALTADTVVFVSPIPYMLKSLSYDSAMNQAGKGSMDPYLSGENHYVLDVMVMSNNRRERKELPDGRIIFTVAKTGWYLA